MYGAFLRAAGAFLVTGLVGSILGETWDLLRPVLLGGQVTKQSQIVTAFDAVTKWFLLLGLLAIIVNVVWNAVIESTLGGRP